MTFPRDVLTFNKMIIAQRADVLMHNRGSRSRESVSLRIADHGRCALRSLRCGSNSAVYKRNYLFYLPSVVVFRLGVRLATFAEPALPFSSTKITSNVWSPVFSGK